MTVGAVRAPEPEAVAAAVQAEAPGVLTAPLTARVLAGGHSWHSYEVTDVVGRRAAVRVAPAGGTLEPYDPRVEATAMRAAAGVVPVPEVLACVDAPNRLGAAYGVHRWVDGDVLHLGQVRAAAAQARYRRAAADALGRIHATCDPSAVRPTPPTIGDALLAEIDRSVADFARGATCRHPGVTIGWRWLRTHLPICEDPPTLCHGDFRLHNLVWSAPGDLAAVLDWERAWPGDPMADVAFTRRFSGWCAVVDDDGVAAYEAAAGRSVDPTRIVYGDRFEHVRSYTSSVRGLRALAEGRTDRLALYAIGEAGQAGAWDLVHLLADGPLDPMPDDGLSAVYAPPLPVGRSAELAVAARDAGDERLAAHLQALDAADRDARDGSLTALRAVADRDLLRVLAAPDPETAWRQAHEHLATVALTGGTDLIPPLEALALRDIARPSLRRRSTIVAPR
jgi:aminoglycoside phosphotransferase (APT) family kinase protein